MTWGLYIAASVGAVGLIFALELSAWLRSPGRREARMLRTLGDRVVNGYLTGVLTWLDGNNLDDLLAAHGIPHDPFPATVWDARAPRPLRQADGVAAEIAIWEWAARAGYADAGRGELAAPATIDLHLRVRDEHDRIRRETLAEQLAWARELHPAAGRLVPFARRPA